MIICDSILTASMRPRRASGEVQPEMRRRGEEEEEAVLLGSENLLRDRSVVGHRTTHRCDWLEDYPIRAFLGPNQKSDRPVRIGRQEKGEKKVDSS